MYLVFDTETSGLPVWAKDPSDSCQPVMIQIAMLLLDDKYQEVASYYSLVAPRRPFDIHPKAQEAHGISKEQIMRYGVDRDVALRIFSEFYNSSQVRIAHNLKFDSFLINIETANSIIFEEDCTDFESDDCNFCTMLQSTDICKIPKLNGGSGYKWPKLAEVYKFAFNEELQDAHDALVDVRATARVFQWLNEKMYVKEVV